MSEQAPIPEQPTAKSQQVEPEHNEALQSGEVILPLGDQLRDIYRLEFEALDLPTTYRMVDYGEEDIVHFNPIDSVPALQEAYIRQATERACKTSWWEELSGDLRDYVVDPSMANIRVTAKHTLDITVGGEPTNQSYEVFEAGESEDDKGAVEVVFDTLKLIDQFSGGLMSADPDRPVIVLGNGIRLADNSGGGETGGFASGSAVFINMSAIKESAQEADTNFHELLAAVTVHEVLGHELERRIKGKTGRYFGEHFDYHPQHRTPGKIFDEVYGSITPRNDLPEDTQPVREYGRINPSEDFATSVDASVAEAMQWTDTTDKMPRFKSEVDPLRRDLAIQLMEEAAAMALKYDGTPGFVGSELRYTINEGEVTGIEPVRKMEVSSTYGTQIVEEEIKKLVAKFRPGGEFKVSRGDIV